MTDGRLLVLISLLGLTGAAAAKGSRGVLRTSRKPPEESVIYTLRVWGEGPSSYDRGFSGEDDIHAVISGSGVRFTGGSSVDEESGMWLLEGIEIPADEEEEIAHRLEAGLENFMHARDDVKDWSLEPADG